MRWKVPRPRFRMATLLILIGLIAVVLGIWREYRSPKWAWRRAIHDEDRSKRGDAWYRSHLAPIEGMDAQETDAMLREGLGDYHPEVRLEAVRALDWRHRNTTDNIPLFVPLLKDKDYQVRRTVATDLGNAIPEGGEDRDLVVPAILPLLDDPLPIVRQDAVEAIGTIARKCGKAADPLMDQLRRKFVEDPDEHVRIVAARAMTWSGAGDESEPMLRAFLLRTYDPAKRSGSASLDVAFNALARIADRSDGAVEFLLANVYRRGAPLDQNHYYQTAVLASQMGEMGGQRVVRLGLDAIRGDDLDLKVGAATVLEAIGDGKFAVPAWIDALARHPAPDVRRHAVWSLRSMVLFPGKPDAPEALEALRRAASDADLIVRRDAAEGVLMVERRPGGR